MKDKTTIVNIDNIINALTTLTNLTGEGFINSLEGVYDCRGNNTEIIEDITCGGVDLGEKGPYTKQNNEYQDQLNNMLKYFKEIKAATQISNTPAFTPYIPGESTDVTPDGEPTYDDTKDTTIDTGEEENKEASPVGSYTLRSGNIDIYDENGNKIGTLGVGTYNVYAIKYDENGNIIAVRISKDGEPEQWIYFNKNDTNAYVVLPGQVGTYTTHGKVDIYDKDGNKIGTLDEGTYTVYAVKYDDKGNVIAVRISKDGEPEQWIYLNNPNVNAYFTEPGQVGTYTLLDGSLDVYDANGNKIDTITAGTYTVYAVKYDSNGNIIAIRISKDGEPERWIYFNNPDINGKYIDLGQIGTYTDLDPNVTIYNENGEPIGTITGGTYRVYEVKYDSNGNIIAIRISKDGEPEQWIYINNPNINGYFIEVGQVAIYNLRSGTLNIYDANGNIIGTITPGSYNVYEVKYDVNGNVIAIRISKDGEPEQWVYININNQNGDYYPIDQQTNVGNDKDGKGVLNLYNKKNSHLLGILGIIAIIVGTGFVLKKKLKKKNENGEDEYEEEFLSDEIEPGEYKIYETLKDEDDNVKEVRISDDNENEELWLGL